MNIIIRGIVCLLGLWSAFAAAEPYLAYKLQSKCSTCHINPIGGGMRNTFGNHYGYNQLPAKAWKLSSAEMGKLNDFIGLGGNLRYNGEYARDDSDSNTSTFRIDSAQLYLAISPSDKLTLYVDQQIAPGSAVNREAFVLYRFDSGHYVKAGKMFAPVGLRLEDDSTFIRQTSGFNFDSSDNGVELGLEYDQTTVNLFVLNGTSAVSNNDNQFLFGARVEHLFGAWRLGTTLLSNPSTQGDETLFNLYGGYHWRDFTFLAEADWIRQEQQDGESRQRWAGLAEVNYQLRQGLNLKLTAEYFDPDTDIDENHEVRYSLLAEYAPLSNMQLRVGFRHSEGIPQQPQRSVEKLFAQLHLYF